MSNKRSVNKCNIPVGQVNAEKRLAAGLMSVLDAQNVENNVAFLLGIGFGSS